MSHVIQAVNNEGASLTEFSLCIHCIPRKSAGLRWVAGAGADHKTV